MGERTSRLPYPRALCASALALGAYVAGTPAAGALPIDPPPVTVPVPQVLLAPPTLPAVPPPTRPTLPGGGLPGGGLPAGDLSVGLPTGAWPGIGSSVAADVPAGAAAPASGAPPSAPDEPAPFDPGDRTNVLAVLGLLEVDPVAVACIAAASAGLPASPSCSSAAPRSGGDDVGMLPINGAQSMLLVVTGAALMGVGAFFVGLARRSSAGGRRDIFARLATPSRGYD